MLCSVGVKPANSLRPLPNLIISSSCSVEKHPNKIFQHICFFDAQKFQRCIVLHQSFYVISFSYFLSNLNDQHLDCHRPVGAAAPLFHPFSPTFCPTGTAGRQGGRESVFLIIIALIEVSVNINVQYCHCHWKHPTPFPWL